MNLVDSVFVVKASLGISFHSSLYSTVTAITLGFLLLPCMHEWKKILQLHALHFVAILTTSLADIAKCISYAYATLTPQSGPCTCPFSCYTFNYGVLHNVPLSPVAIVFAEMLVMMNMG